MNKVTNKKWKKIIFYWRIVKHDDQEDDEQGDKQEVDEQGDKQEDDEQGVEQKRKKNSSSFWSISRIVKHDNQENDEQVVKKNNFIIFLVILTT